mmetsp:Transcript_90868/g.259969  ORF Transcript_90868/g.259969 Transcript_90868/m.259969 type:complete len:245 (-) Transcript_90868:1069-1803(-)
MEFRLPPAEAGGGAATSTEALPSPATTPRISGADCCRLTSASGERWHGAGAGAEDGAEGGWRAAEGEDGRLAVDAAADGAPSSTAEVRARRRRPGDWSEGDSERSQQAPPGRCGTLAERRDEGCSGVHRLRAVFTCTSGGRRQARVGEAQVLPTTAAWPCSWVLELALSARPAAQGCRLRELALSGRQVPCEACWLLELALSGRRKGLRMDCGLRKARSSNKQSTITPTEVALTSRCAKCGLLR